MVTSVKERTPRKAPAYRNIHITQIASYRLPAAGWASILHRISGASVFLLLPFAIWMFDSSLTSETSFDGFASVFAYGIGAIPSWFVKLVAFALLWAYLIHFCVGLRHLWMDATHSVDVAFGRVSALVAIAAGTVIAFAVGAKVFLVS